MTTMGTVTATAIVVVRVLDFFGVGGEEVERKVVDEGRCSFVVEADAAIAQLSATSIPKRKSRRLAHEQE
jgi:hypothetical protein